MEAAEIKTVDIYTDGACSGNPGSGGYGVVLLYNGARKELSAGYRLTTNNRMEVLAVIKGLECLKEKCRVNLYSDSKYVVDAVNKGWAKKWRANGWKRGDKKPERGKCEVNAGQHESESARYRRYSGNYTYCL